jgi:hypothetical protein
MVIEEKELGVKIAENPIEALWTRARDAGTARIKDLENTLIIEKAFVEMCEQKLNSK